MRVEKLIQRDCNNVFVYPTSITVNSNGIVGDSHYGLDQTIWLLSKTVWDYLQKDKLEYMCLNRFYPSIILSSTAEMRITDFIYFNEVQLEIIRIGKVCHQKDGCLHMIRHKKCMLMENAIQTKIRQTGILALHERMVSAPCIDMAL